jgi:hypothetical protein
LIELPPLRRNPDGEPRRIGVELEMNGMELDAIARTVAECLGCAIEPDGRYQRRLRGDPDGDWFVELDFRLLKEMGREDRVAGDPVDELKQSAESLLHTVAEHLVPVEVVSPPLAMTRLGEVEGLIVALREAGARGTSDRFHNAFGMQLNPEIPSADPGVLVACLKAFLCLYPWLFARADIDLTRRITRYVDPFPVAYIRQVIEAGYEPDLAGLIDDYLEHNPTRNRALDLLPLFLHLDPDRVRAAIDDPLIKARPAFHYRLPDCDIHRPEWGLHRAWGDWLQVERLAVDRKRLAACCSAYAAFLDRVVDRWFGSWEDEVAERWLDR